MQMLFTDFFHRAERDVVLSSESGFRLEADSTVTCGWSWSNLCTDVERLWIEPTSMEPTLPRNR